MRKFIKDFFRKFGLDIRLVRNVSANEKKFHMNGGRKSGCPYVIMTSKP